MSITIKKATANDAASIMHIQQIAFQEYHLLLGQETPTKAMQEDEQDILDEIEKSTVYIAEYNNIKNVGSIRLSMLNENSGLISRFAVLPHWQKSGAGSALLEKAESWFLKQNASTITLYTAMDMPQLVNYYLHCGFVLTSVSDEDGYLKGVFVKKIRT